ncbi:MAG: sigma-70 family RNA polymerase sigma factor [Rhodomicrobiaceae bacterium]|jgi:RNA polymerase sigma-70 factor (ECF subfamily)
MYVQYKSVPTRRVDVTKNETTDHHKLLELIALNRDKEAFEQLFIYFAPRVKAVLMKQSSDANTAEDLMQETMLTVWNKADKFSKYRGSVSAWIFTIARNKRIDGYRKQGTKHYLDIEDIELTDDAMGSEEILISNERDKMVTDISNTLPIEQKEIIEMSFVKELSQTEISKKLGIPLGTVKSRMRLAYEKIRKSVEEVL